MTKISTICFKNAIVNFDYITRICREDKTISIYFTHEPFKMDIVCETEECAIGHINELKRRLDD